VISRIEVEGDGVEDDVIAEGFVDLVGGKHKRPMWKETKTAGKAPRLTLSRRRDGRRNNG